MCHVLWIDKISDTCSQGYTDLQTLVKCLDHRDVVLDMACSQKKVVLGCAMHRNALECISEAILPVVMFCVCRRW